MQLGLKIQAEIVIQKNSNTVILPYNHKGDVFARAISVKNASQHWADLNIFLQVDRLLVSKLACHGEWYLSVKISCEVVHITSFSFLPIISQDKVSEPDKGKCGYVCLHMFVFFTLSFCILFSSWFISPKLVLHITKKNAFT